MTVEEALELARRHGVNVMLEGDSLHLEADAPPPNGLLAILGRGKWGAATYTLSRIVTEEATPHNLTEEDPTPYAPYDAYGSAVGSRKKPTTGAEDPGPRPQDNEEIPIKPETIGIIGGIGGDPTSGRTPTTTVIVAPPSAALATETALDEGPANSPKWTARL